MYVCMCVCIYIHTYIYMHTCMCVPLCIYTSIYVRTGFTNCYVMYVNTMRHELIWLRPGGTLTHICRSDTHACMHASVYAYIYMYILYTCLHINICIIYIHIDGCHCESVCLWLPTNAFHRSMYSSSLVLYCSFWLGHIHAKPRPARLPAGLAQNLETSPARAP